MIFKTKMKVKASKTLFAKFCSSALIIMLITNPVSAQEKEGLTFGGDKNDIGFEIIESNDGSYLMVGSTKSFGVGSSDILAIKLDTSGTVIWMKTYGWPHHDVARSVIEVEDGYILIGDAWDYGHSRLDIYALKIDSSGNIVWNNMYGTNSKDIGFKALEIEQSDILLLGYTRGFDPAGDIFVLRTDSEGNEIWRNNFGTNYDDYGFDLAINGNNTFVVIGTKAGFYNDVYSTYFNSHDADILLVCIDFDGNEVWRKTYGGDGHDFGNSIVTTDGNIYFCGSTQSEGNGSFDILLQKTDSEGNKEWSKTFGGPDYEYGNAMDQNSSGDLYILGTTKSFGQNQSADCYLLKVDEQGNEQWSLSIGGDFVEQGKSVFATSDGGVAIVGISDSYGNGKFDVFFVKVNKYGIIEDIVNNIDSIYKGDFLVYPNPVGETGHFKTLQTVPKEELYLELFSMTGQQAATFTITLPNYSFPTSTIPSGSYFYRVKKSKDSEIISTGKLIIR